jgi:hypothetical protein
MVSPTLLTVIFMGIVADSKQFKTSRGCFSSQLPKLTNVSTTKCLGNGQVLMEYTVLSGFAVCHDPCAHM